jgi:hypothetical protein
MQGLPPPQQRCRAARGHLLRSWVTARRACRQAFGSMSAGDAPLLGVVLLVAVPLGAEPTIVGFTEACPGDAGGGDAGEDGCGDVREGMGEVVGEPGTPGSPAGCVQHQQLALCNAHSWQGHVARTTRRSGCRACALLSSREGWHAGQGGAVQAAASSCCSNVAVCCTRACRSS